MQFMGNDGVYDDCSFSDKVVFYNEYPSDTTTLINIEQYILAPILLMNTE